MGSNIREGKHQGMCIRGAIRCFVVVTLFCCYVVTLFCCCYVVLLLLRCFVVLVF